MRILVVEDDATLRQQLCDAMTAAGHTVDMAADGREGHYLGEVEAIDAVVLDLGLPHVDGLTVLRRWREAGRKMPVLILTARGAWHEKVAGMDAGADDYLAKPFHMEELLARLRALLRRLGAHGSAQWECGPIRLDTTQARVWVQGAPLMLTSHEFKLLSLLMQRKGEVLSRTELSEHLYPHDSDRDSNTIEVFVARLRKKLPLGCIATVRGLGYKLVDQPWIYERCRSASRRSKGAQIELWQCVIAYAPHGGRHVRDAAGAGIVGVGAADAIHKAHNRAALCSARVAFKPTQCGGDKAGGWRHCGASHAQLAAVGNAFLWHVLAG